MKNFLDENFLLETDTSKDLYHNYAEKEPIFDFHNHLSAQEIYENKYGTDKMPVNHKVLLLEKAYQETEADEAIVEEAVETDVTETTEETQITDETIPTETTEEVVVETEETEPTIEETIEIFTFIRSIKV